ncbi:MAG: hypothetical protein GC137_10305 [Alphaproteobacteria bacterium]|nr:hypothetical protein [Alphaproteobacteria bacterium]
MKKKRLLKLFALELFLLIPFQAQAQADIYPLYAVLTENNKSADILLHNTGENTVTYIPSWKQLEQEQSNGGYIEISEEERAKRTDFEDIGMFEPAKLTLVPHEKKSIKISVKNIEELDGEYKSHLKIAPDISNLNATGELQIVTSYSIPVIYRAGKYDATFKIETPEFVENQTNGKIDILIPITRSGTHGAIGKVLVFSKPEDDEEIQIGILKNASIFPEITKRVFTVATDLGQIPSGRMRVLYISEESSSQLDELVFHLPN